METKIRQVAYKVPISALIRGDYIKNDEEFAPNYIIIGKRKVSRVNIIGVVVELEKEETKANSMIIDDGTEKISVRGFEEFFVPLDLNIGSIVNVIGRPREFSNEKYIIPEIIKLTKEGWMRLRKHELGSFIKAEHEENEAEIEEETITEEHISGIVASHEKVLQLIKEKDKGKGADIDEVIKEIAMPDPEKVIEDMLKEGNIFENMPGKIKVLE